MEAVRKQHSDMVSELQAKLRWYAENQALLDRNDGLVKEQQDVIRALEARWD